MLIIDEAQNLSVDVLEQLRLLTNLETNQRKLLQIILIGQPELLSLLSQPELRQLSQRITARFHLDALGREEVAEYIDHRLSIAGAQRKLFHPSAVNRIFRLSHGIPRLVNLICDRALLGAYVENRSMVTGRVVRKAAGEILGEETRPALGRPGLQAALAAAIVLGMGAALLHFPDIPPFEGPGTTSREEPAQAVEKAPDITNEVKNEEPAERPIVAASATTAIDIGEVEPVPESAPTGLARVRGHADRGAAFVDLFFLWDITFSREDGAPCAFAASAGLMCMNRTGSLREIAHLNRPAILRLSAGDKGQWFTLSGLQPDTAHIKAGSEEFAIDRQELIDGWDGNYTLLWRAPPDYRYPVQRGDTGTAVDWLVSRLDTIEDRRAGIRTGSRFDDDLERRVKRFQLSVGLTPDGIAGARTWIHINSREGADVPRLQPSGRG